MKCIPLRLFLLLILVYSISLVSCGQQVKTHKPVDSLAQDMDKTIPGNFTQHSTDVFDSTQLTPFFKKYPDLKTYASQVTDFYQKRKYAYAWFENGSLIEQAGNLTNRIMNLDNDGIYKKAPYAKALDSLLDGLNTKTTSKQPRTDVELMLTSQYFMLANLIWHGMGTDASKSAKWFLPREKDSYDQYLDSLLKTPTKQLTNEPVYRQYELLRTYLKKYRDLDSSDKWVPITIAVKSVKLGDSLSAILPIKKRLYKLGDYKGDTTTNVFTAELVSGVKQFQTRLGLPVNGLVNRETINEMNVPLKSRIKQILVNMERSRWLPASMKGDYLGVNIPEFKLHVYNNDSLLWSCNVVVGQSVHQTTVFYGEIKYVVFSPYWNVPESIVRNEVIPGMRKNANYISKHNMQITGYVNGLPNVRQKPGPENSLGLVKFLFPNSYSIYLHDTPSKSLFGESSRAFSHGCIRVKEPAKLADFLLQQRKEWTPQKINAAMHTGKEQYVTLNNKIPVFIAYLTAFVDRDGKINFRKDIYNLDGRLADMLMKQNGTY
ncbi:Putative peptidoglycan binding domain-containing protein [Mucilaginibacter mallensis]|uniref:Putative peptidoglycan binding domain-containing protein n=1 Tax=Mucilaginibacter mallensis TaxID=652787 RepID=A0A1H2B1P3_MUCMA|nr:L,D-transpeptidase family protein [Mucilaginibacter mallensis]SDT52002.1 Putative peptidoglycan binding domain-containing protein [Mucilaginibacter mallensis]